RGGGGDEKDDEPKPFSFTLPSDSSGTPSQTPPPPPGVGAGVGLFGQTEKNKAKAQKEEKEKPSFSFRGPSGGASPFATSSGNAFLFAPDAGFGGRGFGFSDKKEENTDGAGEKKSDDSPKPFSFTTPTSVFASPPASGFGLAKKVDHKGREIIGGTDEAATYPEEITDEEEQFLPAKRDKGKRKVATVEGPEDKIVSIWLANVLAYPYLFTNTMLSSSGRITP
ncbi:hypothetical protein HK097_010915, partial [Rhizophlyctis rosea]